MATLADLLASVNTGNMTGQGLPSQQPTNLPKRKFDFVNAIGRVADAMAALGGNTPYQASLDAKDKQFRQQGMRNYFAELMQNPQDQGARNQFLRLGGDIKDIAALEQMNAPAQPKPFQFDDRIVEYLGPGQVREAYVKPAGAPKEAPLTGFAGVLAARERFPEGSRERQALDAYIEKQTRIAPTGGGGTRAASGGGGGVSRPLSAAEKAEYGLPANQPWIFDNKGQPRLPTGYKPGAAGPEASERLGSVVETLRGLYNTLDLEGGAVSEDAGALGNLANIAATEVPIAGRIVGSRAQTIRDSIMGQRAALFNAIAKVQGVTATQLNTLPELKLQILQATDPSQSIQANRQALDFIEKNYLSGPRPDLFRNAKPSQNNAPVAGVFNGGRPVSAQQAARLPAGTQFVGEDGVMRVKR